MSDGGITSGTVGLCVGPLLMIGSIAMLVWNEGRSVARYRDLDETEALLTSVKNITTIDGKYEGKVLHLIQNASAEEYVVDGTFGLIRESLKLWRDVETYQWYEERESNKNSNSNSDKVTFTYHQRWDTQIEDSSFFEVPENHENPKVARFEEQRTIAPDITYGPYSLADEIIHKMDWYHAINDVNVSYIPDSSTKAKDGVKEEDPYFYYGNGSLAAPQVGDTRVRFWEVPYGYVSIIAEQSGDMLIPYTTTGGRTVCLVQEGRHTSAEMITKAEGDNQALTWTYRGVGVLLMFLGFVLCFAPCLAIFTWIPFLGDLVGGAVYCFGLLFSLFLSGTVIAISWVAYRPVVGFSVLAGALALLGGAVLFVMNRRARAQRDGSLPEYD